MSYLKKIEYSFWKKSQYLLKSNKNLQNIHKGETCFILGNGGSLKNFDLSVLSNSLTMGVSYSLIDNRSRNFHMNYCVIPSALIHTTQHQSHDFYRRHLNPGFAVLAP